MKNALDDLIGQLSMPSSKVRENKNGPYDEHLRKVLMNEEKPKLEPSIEASFYQVSLLHDQYYCTTVYVTTDVTVTIMS